MNFGENLKKLRKSKKMSQETLAEMVDVSRQSVSKWENSEAYPEMKNIMLLCDIFGCKINELIDEDVKDAPLVDEEVKQVVIKFQEKQQSRMKILSKLTYVIAKIAKVVSITILVLMFIAICIIPFLSKYFEITENTLTIFDNNYEYSIDSDNVLTIDSTKHYISTSSNLREFVSSHSKKFYIVSVEYILISLFIQMIFLFLLLHNVENLYKNINKLDTPFTLKNVEHMNLIAIFLSLELLLPKIFATIYSFCVRLDLAIEYKVLDLIIILIVFSLTYIFKYGYEIQLDSKGKIYKN